MKLQLTYAPLFLQSLAFEFSGVFEGEEKLPLSAGLEGR
jgi:hypothetical protein